MRLEEVHPKHKSSFLRFITNLVSVFAEEHKLYEIEDKITPEVLALFRREIEENCPYTFNKWADFISLIGEEEFATAVLGRVNAYRRKKVTLKQVDYYTGMYRTLEDEVCEIPTDFLEFQYKLSRLKEAYLEEGPATEAQIKAIKKQWFEKTGTRLTPPKFVTRGFISRTFDKLDDWPYFKIKKVEPVVKWNEANDEFRLYITFNAGKMCYEAVYNKDLDDEEWIPDSVVHRKDGECFFCRKDIELKTAYSNRCNGIGSHQLIEYLTENFEKKFNNDIIQTVKKKR
ncbi:hypothetical protein [Priestia megaterium]|uniref:hypothetical protein n=1 Tax=Priestia megaterium TaxID=1404 RepID=UPI0031019D47